MDAKDKFDSSSWQQAYIDADLSPETKQIKGITEDLLKKSGIPGQAMGLSQAVDFWDQQEKNELDLIRAELGDETFIMLKGGNYSHGWDLAGNRHSFPVYLNTLAAYKRKGDEESVHKLLNVLPEGSVLWKKADRQVTNTQIDLNYDGYDATDNMGKLIDVKIGNRYDLQPGIVDFREYVNDGKLDIGMASTSMLLKLDWSMRGYSEFWDELNYTLNNIRQEFGDEVREQLWEDFEKKYRKVEAEHEPLI